MPDGQNPRTGEVGVRVTLRQIHEKVEETSDQLIEIKHAIRGYANHEDRISKIERSISAHAVIITLVIGTIGAGLARIFS